MSYHHLPFSNTDAAYGRLGVMGACRKKRGYRAFGVAAAASWEGLILDIRSSLTKVFLSSSKIYVHLGTYIFDLLI